MKMKYTYREFDNTDIYCDYCGHIELVEGTDFSGINKELRSRGWVIKKVNGSWKDFCCKECYQNYVNREVE